METYNTINTEINESNEVDFRLRDIQKQAFKVIRNETCKGLIKLLDKTGTKVTVEHGDHMLNMMYTVVDNSKPYNEYRKHKKSVNVNFNLSYDKTPGKKSHYISYNKRRGK